MITTANLEKVLRELKYSKDKTKKVYIKEYPEFQCAIKVDFENKNITYPENKGMIIVRKNTCNFSENENFVVLECITRLMDKGYKPEHIELEKPMPGGHHDTGGFCDILIKDNDGKTFLLIECKKADDFDTFWKKMLFNGGQLFNYYNSFRQAQALCLYTSDYNDDSGLKFTSHIVSMVDNDEYLQSDKKLKSFRQVQAINGGKEEYFEVWRDTYQQDYNTKGIFEDDIATYTVGKLKYTVKDLVEVDNDSIQKKYHEFATILRQHNVGSHENAFNKLVNLFLAKIVDESMNINDLQFYWKGAAHDDYFNFQDRLQKLYKEGMEKFLGEKVTYIDQKEISDAFHLFKNDPDATRTKVLEYFRQLKFFTNNDFAILDVHNESLFYQNVVILKKIVQMLQDIKLKTKEQNQFLGDLFEGFLDQGVKQSEGQYFTPTPIVKFLVSSLPLEEIIKNHTEIPKTIDYSCGAGHFLTEYASCIKSFVGEHKNLSVSDYYKEIYGIEKEYRLSKVSKVSAFMYGQDNIQIIYGDALAKNAKIENNSFSVLIANPPYSVKGFLETLTEEERKSYTLTSAVSDISKNNSIETFFVERAKQLLMADGVAAIILPSSVLSNGNIYISCREIILKYFDIVAIAEFGRGTFGKTGTNTVTLFLKRRKSNPDIAEHYENRVNCWFEADDSKDIVFEDDGIIVDYCNHCNVNVSEFIAWLKGGRAPSAEIFEDYKKKAKDSSGYRNIEKKKITQKYSQEDKDRELASYTDRFIKNAEKEKLYFFMLTANNACPVVVTKSPSDSKAIKAFLGYEWSGAKGSEGIKYIGTTVEDEADAISMNKGISSIVTPLFDPHDYNSENKINTIIRNNFEKGIDIIPETLKEYVSAYRLVDMIDFSRADFDKSIRTSGIQGTTFDLKSKYTSVKLDKLADISRGASPRPIERYLTENANGVNWIKIGDVPVGDKYITQTRQKITPDGVLKSKLVYPGDFIISNSMSVGRPYILKIKGCIHDGWLLVSNISKEVDKDYLYYILSSDLAQKQLLYNALGGVVKNLNTSRVESVKIPLPPIEIQKQIAASCEAVDAEYDKADKIIKELIEQIDDVVENVNGKEVSIKNVCETINPSKTEIRDVSDDVVVSFVEMASVSNNGYIKRKADKPLKELRKGSYTYFSENDIIIAKITPCMENGKCALATGLTNGIGMGSSEFHVFRAKNEIVLPDYLFHVLNRDSIRKAAAAQMTGSSGHRRVPITFYENLVIVLPTLVDQQRLVDEIEKIKLKIAAKKAIMDQCADRKRDILENELFR